MWLIQLPELRQWGITDRSTDTVQTQYPHKGLEPVPGTCLLSLPGSGTEPPSGARGERTRPLVGVSASAT